MSNLHIVTVATSSEYYFPYLKESCKNNGKELEILGFGEKWEGFNWRFLKMIEYLKKLPKTDIVCFIDGYDILCIRNLIDLTKVFLDLKLKHNCKIIVGSDDNVNSLMKLAGPLYFGRCNNKPLNAGTYIGYVEDLLLILSNIYNLNPTNDADDQVLMTKYCNLYPNDIYIDINNELFLTLGYPLYDLYDLVNFNNGVITYNNNNPFFIHAPGYGILDTIVKKLNYDTNNTINIKDKLYKNFFEKKIMLYVNYILSYENIILCILTILLLTIFYYKKQ
jgi:hypothetical protein